MKKLISILLFLVAVVPLFAYKQPLIVVPLKTGYDIYWYYWEGGDTLHYYGRTDTTNQNNNGRSAIELPGSTIDNQQQWLWVGGWCDVRKRFVYSAWHYVGGTNEMEAVLDLDNWVLNWWTTGKTTLN